MKESFGQSLVRAEIKDGEFVVVDPPLTDSHVGGGTVIHPPPSQPAAGVKIEGAVEGGVVKVDVLPSPEDLRGRVLLKVCS
jgi:hypothetical protein